MTAQESTKETRVKEEQTTFQKILSDAELTALFVKHGVQDERKRKLFVRCFFWLMVFSAGEPSRRGCLLQLIGFFLGAAVLLFPESEVRSLSKNAVSKRLKEIPWYLFRGVYNHLLERYKQILDVKETKYLGRFQDAFAVDGSVIALHKKLERVFQSIHKGSAHLKLNTEYSLKTTAVSKLQVSDGKRHDSRFSFGTPDMGGI